MGYCDGDVIVLTCVKDIALFFVTSNVIFPATPDVDQTLLSSGYKLRVHKDLTHWIGRTRRYSLNGEKKREDETIVWDSQLFALWSHSVICHLTETFISLKWHLNYITVPFYSLKQFSIAFYRYKDDRVILVLGIHCLLFLVFFLF